MNQSDAYRAAYRVRHGTDDGFREPVLPASWQMSTWRQWSQNYAPGCKKASITLESHLAHRTDQNTMRHQIAKQIILQPIETLIPYARNSRTHSDEQVAQIAASIRGFGFTNPVLVDDGRHRGGPRARDGRAADRHDGGAHHQRRLAF